MNQSKFISQFTILYCFLVFGIYPLFVTDYYFNIQKSKSYFFIISTTVCFLILVISHFILVGKNRKPKENNLPFLILDQLFLLYFLIQIVSFWVSPYKADALLGENGRWFGFLVHICFYLSFFLLSRYLETTKILYILFISSSLVFLLGFINHLGLDPFGFYTEIAPGTQISYISTIGNINVFSSFVSIMLPIGIGYFCLCENKLQIPVYFYICFGYLGLISGNSDSGFLSIGFLFLILPLFFCETWKALSHMFLCQLGFWPCALLIHVLDAMPKIHNFPLNGIPAALTTLPVILTGFILNLIIFFLCYLYQKKKLPFSPKNFRTIYICLLIIGMIITAIFCIIIFDDSFGSHRGYIWKRTILLIKEFPPLRKFFGYGADTFSILFCSLFEEESLAQFKYIYDNAHCEFLQYIVTSGICGAISWLTLLGSGIILSFRNYQKYSPVLFALGCSVLCYFVQSFVNVSQPVTTPYVFLILGIIGSILFHKQH